MADEIVITPNNNGPLHVKGRFRLVLPSGRELETEEETWLCRCGGSQHKPFCDGTHRRIGFKATEVGVDSGESADGYQAVADEKDVKKDELLEVEVAGKPVVLARVEGRIYAIGGVCSHQAANLAEGELDGDVVVCPLHDSGFNVKTGEAVRLPAETPVPTYDVTIHDGRVWVARMPRNQ